ncbi:MAG: leucine-rich repeat protein, partial [Bacteroidales bacterium]|nr:leucine-rich repeat protein [Bacteroidales bacterium]
ETDFRPYGTAFEDFYPRVESVIIDGSVKNINKGAFLGSSTLTNLVLEDGVESIMYAAFYDCDIRELDIPCSVTSIARDAFNFNKNLTKVTFCDGLQSLGIEAFRNCDLREVTIPKNVFWVDIETFMNNPNLSKVVIEDGVKRLYDKCFAECAENLEIYVPSSVTIFGENITDPTATWVVVKGSEAHKYAVKNNYKIRFMSPDDNITAVTNTETQNLNIYAIDHTIVVENANSEILVYDAIGRLVCRDATPCVRAEIPMEKSGVYVVKVGNLAKKVIVE